MRRQSQRCLAVARAAIPGDFFCGRDLSQILKQRRRVVRTVFGIVGGLGGEMIFKGHAKEVPF
jgi:hypothetical protein